MFPVSVNWEDIKDVCPSDHNVCRSGATPPPTQQIRCPRKRSNSTFVYRRNLD